MAEAELSIGLYAGLNRGLYTPPPAGRLRAPPLPSDVTALSFGHDVFRKLRRTCGVFSKERTALRLAAGPARGQRLSRDSSDNTAVVLLHLSHVDVRARLLEGPPAPGRRSAAASCEEAGGASSRARGATNKQRRAGAGRQRVLQRARPWRHSVVVRRAQRRSRAHGHWQAGCLGGQGVRRVLIGSRPRSTLTLPATELSLDAGGRRRRRQGFGWCLKKTRPLLHK